MISGLILAAPFGAVMATVSTYLVVIASGVVRDIYQRFLRPRAGDDEIRRVSHVVMILFGLIGVVGEHPARSNFLQTLIVFSTTATASTFVAPALMLAFWRRATAAGTIAAMLAGAGTILALFIVRVDRWTASSSSIPISSADWNRSCGDWPSRRLLEWSSAWSLRRRRRNSFRDCSMHLPARPPERAGVSELRRSKSSTKSKASDE